MAASPGPRRGCIVRPNAHDWKSCEGNTSEGSNPSLSASAGDAPQVEVHLWRLYLSIHVSRCHIEPTVLDPTVPMLRHIGRCTGWVRRQAAFRQSHAQGKNDTKQHRASRNRAHRHGYTRTLPAPPPTMPFCHTHHGLGLCQVSAWSTLDAMPHTPSGFGTPGPRTATHQRVPEARLAYRSVRRETKHSPSCRTRSSAKKRPGFTEQIAACTILPENTTKVN